MSLTEECYVRGVVLACGEAAESLAVPEGVRVHALPSRPGKNDVDPLLTGELVVAGTDADLAAVVLRLLRKDKLGTTPVGYVPVGGRSTVAAIWKIPSDSTAAMDLALTGSAGSVPLVRDDAGGVLLGRGVLEQPRGVAYCDDAVAFRGEASSVVVRPDSEGLVVTVTRGTLFRRKETFRGRAFQFGGTPLSPLSDGVAYPRPMQRWTWYRHTHDLRLVLPSR